MLLLQVPFPEYSEIQDISESVFTVSMVMSGVSVLIFLVACIQLLRFTYLQPEKHYCKKIIHASIIAQMIGCLLQNLTIGNLINTPCWGYFAIQEYNFVAEAAAYTTIMLFWINFYYGVTYGKAIWPLRSKTFTLISITLSVIYVTLFAVYCSQKIHNCQQGWEILRMYVYWWHVPFFISIACIFLVVTFIVWRKLRELDRRFSSRRNTIKVLVGMSVLTLCRSVIDAILEHVNEHSKLGFYYWDTWVGFFMFFLLESFIPSVVFLVILRKIPQGATSRNMYAKRFDSGFVNPGSTINY